MTWALTTLTTDATLRKHEAEILSLAPMIKSDTQFSTTASSTTVTLPEAVYDAIEAGSLLLCGEDEVFVVSKDDDDAFEVTVSNAVDWSGLSDSTICYYATWSDKITFAKDLLKDDVELRLMKMGYTVDYSENEILIDIINNQDSLANVCDMKVLYWIYQDLANGNEDSPYYIKMLRYKELYNQLIDIKMNLLNIDTNEDGTVDEYRPEMITFTRCLR